jgi:hypothetical protein
VHQSRKAYGWSASIGKGNLKAKSLGVFIVLGLLLLSGLACGGGAPTGTPTTSITAEQIRDQAIAADSEIDT